MNIEEIIRKHALKNAYNYGKADPKVIVGKLIAEFPDAKKDMKTTMKKIAEMVAEVNSLSREQLEDELKNYQFEERKEEKKGLAIPNVVQGKVVTRFPPEPSGYPHIGHAKAAFLDYEIAKKYDGKMILRFDDTNPEKESLEYVEAIKEGLRWLGIEWSMETYTSDRMELLYNNCEKMLQEGKAYVCTCSQEEISKSRSEMKPCGCRSLSSENNLTRWKSMLLGEIKAGEAIVRFKGDLSSQNTVMRDPSLFRIIEAPHYRQHKKYRVWPTYDFEAPIIDALEGVTHPMRTKEYELRDELYFAILNALDLPKPTLIEFSRLSVKGMPISKRLITPLVKEGKVLGWDDPRLPTLSGLRRRGILAEAIRNFVLSFGLSKVESEPEIENLIAENRKLLDPLCSRYFFVADPVELKITNAPEKIVHIKLHPYKDLGFRKVKVRNIVYISGADAEKLVIGEFLRLKDLYNIRITKMEDGMLVAEYMESDEMPAKKIQWVSPSNSMKCEILIPHELVDENGNYIENSLEMKTGYCEGGVDGLETGTIIQFERFGFCRLDKKEENKAIFILSA